MKKRRIGTRRTYRTIRRLSHRCTRFTTRMLNGARRPRKPNDLVIACRWLNVALRIHKRMAKREPNLFGPHAHQYFLETVELAEQQREREAALRRVYGETATDTGDPILGVWAQRYPELGLRAG